MQEYKQINQLKLEQLYLRRGNQQPRIAFTQSLLPVFLSLQKYKGRMGYSLQTMCLEELTSLFPVNGETVEFG